MPITRCRCDKCLKTWSSHLFWGRYDYDLGHDMTVPMDREIGWCAGCADFRSIEEIQTHDELMKEFLKAYDELQNAIPKLDNKTLFGGAVKVNIEDAKLFSIYLKSSVQARMKILWRETRQSNPRCLSCGSTNVTPMNILTGLEHHPDCGGLIGTENPGVRLAIRDIVKIYDTEGNYLR